jgi:ABC-2 type transport system permease protein
MSAWLMLLRREWWEHKAGFGWTPLAIGTLFVLFTLYVLALASGGDIDLAITTITESNGNTLERTFAWNDALLAMLDFSRWSPEQLDHYLGHLLHLIAQPFVYAHFAVALFALAGALNDDRRDRSVLFWKSLPVSDLATVTSKLVLVVWVAPLIAVVAVTATWIAVLALVHAFAASAGSGGFGALWGRAGIPSAALSFVTGYLLQGLWCLPVYAWVLAVSAAVPRSPLVWAGLLPLAPVVLERMFLGSNHLWTWITRHVEFVALPRPGALDHGHATPGVGFADQFALLLTVELWSGVAVGLLFLAAARWYRVRNNDL